MKKLVFLTLAFCLALLFTNLCSAYNYGEVMEKAVWFFDANKCGPDAGANNVFDWRGPCHTSDGDEAGIDLTGGFHDAGDHVKFGLPQAFSASTLGWALYEFREEFDAAGITAKTLQTLKHFTDFFLKGYTGPYTFHYGVGDGGIDHGYWGPPELQTGGRPVWTATPSEPASDMCGQTSAALSLMYLNYRNVNPSYANQCLQAAIGLYDFGRTYLGRGWGGSFYQSSSHFDDLAWAAIWLAVATGDMSYLDPVDAWLDEPNDHGDNNYEKQWTYCWDDVTLGNLLMMTKLTGLPKYYDGLLWNLTWFRDDLQKTPFGLPYLDSWGVLRYASMEAGLAYLVYKHFGNDDFLDMADLIIDYCLGANPRNSSYVTGYGNNPPQHPHHRANEPNRDGVTYGLVGALVGGPDNGDGYVDDVNQYTYTEVALDYNASFLVGLAGKYYVDRGGGGGTPPPTPSPTPTPSPAPTCPPGTGTGLTGNYFDNMNLTGTPVLTRTDSTIDFDWAGGSPHSSVPNDAFSVRWTGQVEARSSEVYTFYVEHDDGVRLWVDGDLLINEWTEGAVRESSGTTSLRIGQKYDITLEFYEDWGDAVCRLLWSTGTLSKKIIPQSQLYPSGIPEPTPTPTSTEGPTPTPTEEPTATPTTEPTATPTEGPTPTPTPTSSFEPGQVRVEARCEESNPNVQSLIRMNIWNEDNAALNNLSARYFMDLSEVYAAGYSAGNVTLDVYYSSAGVTVSPLTAYDTANRIYYYELDWGSYSVAPGARLEANFSIHLTGWQPAWDPANDWSYQELAGSYTNTPYIPVYRSGELIYGLEPGGSPPPTPTATTEPEPTPTPTSEPEPTPTPTTEPEPTPTPTPTSEPEGDYVVNYDIVNDWGGGATIDVTITNNTSSTVNGWTLEWTFPGNQQISNLWGGSYTQTGASVSVTNLDWNADIVANGGSVNFGFNINYSGINDKPTAFTLNGFPAL